VGEQGSSEGKKMGVLRETRSVMKGGKYKSPNIVAPITNVVVKRDTKPASTEAEWQIAKPE
jgi:hypothetical protein